MVGVEEGEGHFQVGRHFDHHGFAVFDLFLGGMGGTMQAREGYLCRRRRAVRGVQ